MSIQHHVLTLSGAAERLSDLLADPAVGGRDDVPLRTISLQPRGANANPIYVGATSVVSATDYGVRLEPGATGVPPAPWILGEHEVGPLRLSNFYVIGTAAQHLHILTVPY
jgi:hypothetical protein